MRFYRLNNYIRSGYEGNEKYNASNMLPYPFKTSDREVDVLSMSNGITTLLESDWYLQGVGGMILSATNIDGTRRAILLNQRNNNTTYGYPLLVTAPKNDEWDIINGTSPRGRLIPSVNISGKFKFRTSIIWGSELDNLWDSTINVSVSINGVIKRAITFSSRAEWFTANPRTQDTSKIILGTYNEYGKGTNEPPDFFNQYTKDGSNLEPEFVNMVWDFGTLPQEVPQAFVNWILINADGIYDYTYNVKSYDGTEVFAEREKSPPLTALTLSTQGDTKTLIMTGVNGVDYTLTWESVTPNGQKFLGLAYEPNSRRASIANGQTTYVTLDSSVTWYEVYATYRPPLTTFDINLYQSSAEVNRVDKTDFLTGVGTLSGVLREECSIIAPSITFKQTTVPSFNYVYIAAFGRYYYVTGITSVFKDVWRMSLSCDVLMTWKDDIRALTAIIARQENRFNPLLLDSELPAQANQNVTVIEFPSGGFNTANAVDRPFLLTVVGA